MVVTYLVTESVPLRVPLRGPPQGPPHNQGRNGLVVKLTAIVPRVDQAVTARMGPVTARQLHALAPFTQLLVQPSIQLLVQPSIQPLTRGRNGPVAKTTVTALKSNRVVTVRMGAATVHHFRAPLRNLSTRPQIPARTLRLIIPGPLQ